MPFTMAFDTFMKKIANVKKEHIFFTREIGGIKKQRIEEASVEKYFEIKPILKSWKFHRKMLPQSLSWVISQTADQ